MTTQTERVRRYDRMPLRRRSRRDQKTGFLHVDASLTRAPAVFEYRRPDGSIIREFRGREDVMSQRNLDSIKGAVVTNDHPPVRVTTRNVRRYQTGQAGSDVVVRGDKIDAPLVITDSDLQSDMNDGKREVSLGYDCDLVMEPGVFIDDDGVRHEYDAIQKNHETNHIAIVTEGRAGSEVRVHMDQTDAIQVDASGATQMTTKTDETGTVKREDFFGLLGGGDKARVTVDGISIELPTAQAQKVADALATRENATAVEKKRADTLEAERDAVTKERDKLKEDADNKDDLREQVQARIDLEDRARPHFKDEKDWTEARKLDDGDLRRKVVEMVHEDMKLDGKSDTYIEAAFDMLPTPTNKDGLTKLSARVVNAGGSDDERTELEKRIDKAMRKDEKLWRKPVPGGWTVDGKTPERFEDDDANAA